MSVSRHPFSPECERATHGDAHSFPGALSTGGSGHAWLRGAVKVRDLAPIPTSEFGGITCDPHSSRKQRFSLGLALLLNIYSKLYAL